MPAQIRRYFSRTRRGEIGHYHHIAGAYLLRYAQENSWREDHRRMSNGDQTFRIAGLAMHKKTSPDFVGYWQRAKVAQSRPGDRGDCSMTTPTDDGGTAAVAIATYAVLFSYLRRAKERGDLADQEIAGLLDLSLTALETLGDVSMIDAARLLLEDTFRVLFGPSPPEPPAPKRPHVRRPKRPNP